MYLHILEPNALLATLDIIELPHTSAIVAQITAKLVQIIIIAHHVNLAIL